jgi:hypothetical protein
MHELTYVVYSHTDYLDILSVQTESLEYTDKILLINKSDKNLDHLYCKYNQVIFYDDSLPYASRLLSLRCLKNEYILFIHDIDIVVKKDDSYINHVKNYMVEHLIDRIDLQCRRSWDLYNRERLSIEFDNLNVELRAQKNINNYIYNVNPSIWKLNVLLDIMENFKNETYRTIENESVMKYCLKYNIYKLYSDNPIKCGWFSCLSFFQFIHITHKGKLLPRSNNQLDTNLIPEYNKIIELLTLNNTNKKFYDGVLR